MTALHTAAANVLARAGVLETVGGYLVNSGDAPATLLPMVRDLHALTLACRELHTAMRVNPDTQTAGDVDTPDCNTCPSRYAQEDRWQTLDDAACGMECKPRVWHLHGADNMRYDPELVKTVNEAVREGER